MRTLAGRALILCLFCMAACRGGATGVQPSGKAETKVVKVDADTPMTTPSGSTYTAPKGWTVTTKSGLILLEDPNHEVSVTFVERKERDGAAAIAAAWQQVAPGFARTVKLTTPRPGRSGWDAFVEIAYEATVAEARHVWADAARKADTWFVTLFDGTREGWGRNPSELRLFSLGYRGRG